MGREARKFGLCGGRYETGRRDDGAAGCSVMWTVCGAAGLVLHGSSVTAHVVYFFCLFRRHSPAVCVDVISLAFSGSFDLSSSKYFRIQFGVSTMGFHHRTMACDMR